MPHPKASSSWRHVMPLLKLIDRVGRSAGSGFHSAFVTTFATEFAAFEELLVPPMLAVGCSNIGLVCDARMASLALSDGSALPRHLGRVYGLYSPPVGQGLFHPKVILQLGRDRGRAFVSSANLTAAGLGGNVEIGAEIECTDEPSPARGMVRAIARWLNSRVVEPGAVRDALDWAWARTPWLAGGADAEAEDAAFMASPGDPGLLGGLVERITGPVDRLWVLSPYWDETLSALCALQRQLAAKRTSVLIDSRNHEFPVQTALPPDTALIDIAEWRPKRFTHAKMILAQTATHDHLLFGSANCTTPALGDGSSGGSNIEATLYRRLPLGEGLAALELDRWLDATPVSPDALPERVPSPPIPLAELSASNPGRFVIEAGSLIWSPPSWSKGEGVVVLAYDANLTILAEISAGTAAGERQNLPLPAGLAETVRFGALRHGDGVSSLAGVEHPALLRRTRREALSGAASRAADWFSHSVDLDLFAMEALDALCKADLTASAADRIAPNRHLERTAVAEAAGRSLSYEDFMRERPRDDRRHQLSESALEGSHCDHVRQLLNRLSAYDEGSEYDTTDPDEEAPYGVPGTGPERESRQPDERRVDAAAFEKAVHAYAQACSVGGQTGAIDVLRLRLWLMLLLYNARCEATPNGLSATLDDRGWPRLTLRVLAAFFSGRDAPIGRLVLEQTDSALPQDYVETWATVLWALDALERRRPDSSAGESFVSFVGKLRVRIAAALMMDAADLEGAFFRDRWIGLERQLGSRV